MDLHTADTLARVKMMEHGLYNWKFKFDGAKQRAGLCSHTRRTISLSRHYAERNGETEILDTILHEIAHALCGPGHGHGEEWKRKAVEIGAKPERCYSEGVDIPKGNYLPCYLDRADSTS